MSDLLSVDRLSLNARAGSERRALVEHLTFGVGEGETLALVGESGSGKSITALAVTGLLPEPAVTVGGGRIEFGGVNLLELSRKERRRLAGSEIAMVFQEPMTALNPVIRIGEQIVEMILAHEKVDRRTAASRACELLEAVRMPDPVARFRAYPHQLSGGQRQRVVIAVALACRPRLLIADEPTTALDVTVQAHILTLLREIQSEYGMSMLFISHDLGVVANIADRVVVMYCGQAVESASMRDIFREPSHPYTRGLLDCIPDLARNCGELQAIRGRMPSSWEPLDACRFAPRCPLAEDLCKRTVPPPTSIGPEHAANCHFAGFGSKK